MPSYVCCFAVNLTCLSFLFCKICVCLCVCVVTGKPVWGESGELVCLKPVPCQPTHFWNDENGSKYLKAYFSTYPGTYTYSTNVYAVYMCKNSSCLCWIYFSVCWTFYQMKNLLWTHLFPLGVWAHGDYCKINPKTGGIVMLGRRSGITFFVMGRDCDVEEMFLLYRNSFTKRTVV